MSKTTGKIKAIWKRLANREYRDAYVAGKIANDIAFQVFYLREHRGLTQGQLAQLAGTKQPQISRIERSIGSLNVATLVKIASAFNVGLSVRFVPFSRLVTEAAQNMLDADVTPFDKDSISTADVPPIAVPTALAQPWMMRQTGSSEIVGGSAPSATTGTAVTQQKVEIQGILQ